LVFWIKGSLLNGAIMVWPGENKSTAAKCKEEGPE